MNALRVVQVTGLLVAIVSSTMIFPLGLALAEGESRAAEAFGLALVIGLVVGGCAAYFSRKAAGPFYRREALGVVATAWIFVALIGCLPFILTGAIPSFVGAYFESMSGFTTTGASVMTSMESMPDGDAMPRSILLWRSLTQWLGGVGIVVLFVAILPALGVSSRQIFHMEVPGIGEKGFMPHIRQTALVLWAVYLALTALCAVALMIAGLDVFHAICHALTTLSTGGFSSHTDSVAHYSSWVVHVIFTVFMFIGGINFTLLFRAARGDFRSLFRNPELRFYFVLFVLASTLITLDLLAHESEARSVGQAMDSATLQVASIGTTTGFASEDFDAWPPLSKLILVLLMFSGASAGSTSGGLKIFRVLLILKYAVLQLRLHVRPRSVERLRVGGETVSNDVVLPVLGMFVMFLVSLLFGALALAALGEDLTTSFTASLAAIANIGPGLGSVGPTCNYAALPDAGQSVLAILMLVGRLEIFTALSLLAPSLWRD